MTLVILLSVLLLLVDVAWTDTCPTQCFCNKVLTSVNCEGKKFMEIPAGLPKSVQKLYLRYNEIAVVQLVMKALECDLNNSVLSVEMTSLNIRQMIVDE